MALQLQMTWQPSLLSPKRKTGPPVGLRNLGNSCYLNSVLQCLTYTPPLANFCLRNQHSSLCDSTSEERKRDCPFCLLEKRIVRSLRLDLPLDAPHKILSCLRIFAEHFRFGHQEDAHEFLRYVIDACHNTCLRLKKLRRKGDSAAGGSSVVKEIFGGALQSQVKCLSCGNESNKVDEIMDISLDVLHGNSLKEAMQKFFQPEVLDGNNKYKCENCKKLVPARKQMSVFEAPNVLVIQLKRFEGMFGSKIDKAIAFEEVLVLSSFMCKASKDPLPEYKLFGTIVHSGYSPESGHYYAYIKDAMGCWYCCNDSFVSLSTLQEVLSEKVYILFFTRTNQRPASVSTSHALNGVKYHDCNGSQSSECGKNVVPFKTLPTKPNTDQSSRKDTVTVSRVGKSPSSPWLKFSNVGSSSSKKGPATINGKVDGHKNKSIVINGHAKDSVCMENGGKDLSSACRSCFERNGKVDIANGEKRMDLVSSNGKMDILSNGCLNTKSSLIKEDGTTSLVKTGRAPDFYHLESSCPKEKFENSGNKRKPREGTSILLAQDGSSRAKVEALKHELEMEAASVLRSCGMSDKVYSFMRSRKRLCAKEGNAPLSIDELKKVMIADAKGTFISQMPESLKENLIKRLRLFSEEQVQYSGT